LHGARCRVCAFSPGRGFSFLGAAAQHSFAPYANAPTDCGFKFEQYKGMDTVPPGPACVDRANRARRFDERPPSHRAADENVAGSGTAERDDLYLGVPGTAAPLGIQQGEEHWWRFRPVPR